MARSEKDDEQSADRRVAVALSYDREADPAPRVSASGKGPVAERILALAREHGIPVREDADLAELLGKLDLDSVIPVEAFVAVAEILSFIYRQNGKLKEQRGTP
ncbi:MAG: EscU/YscU/HrcU family type III secretion system export apparatus switch protein [Alphaproteobacteria bacterium]